MPKKWFLIILAIVVIPVTMTSWKVIQYAQESKSQIYEMHHHVVSGLALNTTNYFKQLNMRLTFAPMLARARQWSEQQAQLSSALLSNNDFACVALLNSAGDQLAKAFDGKIPEFVPDLSLGRDPLFRSVAKKRSPDTGAVYVSGGVSLFDVMYPLENGNYLYVAVRWESLRRMLFDQKVGEAGYIQLIDENARIIGDSRGTAQEIASPEKWAFFKDRKEKVAPWFGEFKDAEDIDSVGAGQWIPGAGWFVLSAQPQSEAYAKTRALRNRAFLWMTASFLGVLFFGYFWVHHISRPITQLSSGVANVTRRRFDVRVPEDYGLEEFRALGQAFNGMMKELKSYTDLQVEKIIEEQTTSKSLLFNIHDGIIMVNEKSQVLFSNDPARKWTIDVSGRGKETFEKSWESLQEYPPWMDVLTPVMEGEKASAAEEFEFPVGGRPRWAKVLAQPVLTESGRKLGIMVVIHDITQEKELDRMKEDFFNGITHDLRTPLAATIGYLGLSELQVPEGEKELSKLVGSARQSAKRALGLVETILTLARLQAGKLNINKSPVHIKEIVEKIASDLSFHAGAKKITLTGECADASLWVSADAGLIERVIENLTGNAIKYTMEGGWVKLFAQAVEGGVEVVIQDNGRGIPPEALKKLFGKFQQVKAEDRSVGFGIGLAFSKGIVEAHGSSIEVESEVGKGSRFHFLLERAQAPASAASKAA